MFDSAFPIGSFNYSSAVEEAYARGINVIEFIKAVYKNVIIRGDLVMAKLAFTNPEQADKILYASKVTKELREMSVNMGRSIVYLNLCEEKFFEKVKKGESPGTYPVVMARLCKCLKIDEKDCLEGIAYSELSQMVFSAIRLGAIDFIQGQKLMLELSYEEENEFAPFNPLQDILSKLHENREPKVFMS